MAQSAGGINKLAVDMDAARRTMLTTNIKIVASSARVIVAPAAFVQRAPIQRKMA